MDQGQYWMWTKRKYSMSSSLNPTNSYPSSYDESWEEQAFAKDAAGAGYIWPPRSYSCSFCRREFRSAQALGGHMNVHRRDRARLKHPCSSQNEILSHDPETQPHKPGQNPFTSVGYLYPSSLCGLAYNTNPSYDPDQVLASPSKVLSASVNKNCKEETVFPLINSSVFQGRHKTSPSHSSKSWSNLLLETASGGEKTSKGLDSGCRSKGDSDKTDVAMSLNLFVRRAHPPSQFETNEADISFKKRKTDASSIPLFPKSSSADKHQVQSQKFEFSPSFIEELDLELRLGYRSQV